MALLPIITLPDPVLRQVSTPVERFDDALRRLAADMLDTMYDAPGIGLAAVQVNIPTRLLVVDVGDESEDGPGDASPDESEGAQSEPRQPVAAEQRQPVAAEQRQPVAAEQRKPVAAEQRKPIAAEQRKPQVRRPIVIVNPRILKLGDARSIYEEGCLSLPDVRIDVERPATLVLAYQDLDGHPHELAAEGLTATVLQHEIDHLDGRLIIDYLTSLKRDIIIRRFKKQARIG